MTAGKRITAVKELDENPKRRGRKRYGSLTVQPTLRGKLDGLCAQQEDEKCIIADDRAPFVAPMDVLLRLGMLGGRGG